jgi:hypothetical protein
MTQWVLFLMLSAHPPTLVPVEFFNSKAECLTAKREEVNANIKLGLGGGATYICQEY